MLTEERFSDLLDNLEQQVDTYTLEVVLDALHSVCVLKAQHIAENWQDTGLANQWFGAANQVGKILKFASDRGL